MLLSGEQDFTAGSHDSFDGDSLVMVTLRQATRRKAALRKRAILVSGSSLRVRRVNYGIQSMGGMTCQKI
jgi:hypothetical protein